MKKNSSAACAIEVTRTGSTRTAHFDIAIKVYKNRIFIAITDNQKLGTLINVTRESSPGQIDSDIYNLSVLFGKETADILATARHIAEAIGIDRPLLLSLATKKIYLAERFPEIIVAINKLKTW